MAACRALSKLVSWQTAKFIFKTANLPNVWKEMSRAKQAITLGDQSQSHLIKAIPFYVSSKWLGLLSFWVLKKKIHALRTGSILKLSHLACILLRALFSNKCKEFILSMQSGRRCGGKSEIWSSRLTFVTVDITYQRLWLACDLAHW